MYCLIYFKLVICKVDNLQSINTKKKTMKLLKASPKQKCFSVLCTNQVAIMELTQNREFSYSLFSSINHIQ